MTDIRTANLLGRGATALRSTNSFPSGVRLSRSRHHKIGSNMNNREILNVFEGLLRASQHPGIRHVQAYGPGVGGLEGVKVRFGWGAVDDSWAYLFIDEGDLKPTPMPFADKVPLADVPDAKTGGTVEKWLLLDYTLKFVYDLCEAAKPAPLASLTPIAVRDTGLGHGPTGLGVTCADGTKRVLRATIGSGQAGDPKSDPWAEYVIPVEEVKQWQKRLTDIPKEPARL